MTVLIGTAPDQVPTNGMLGTLAFKDEEGYLFSQTMPAIKPTLNLDFINSKQVDPRITFARGTTATYYDGKTTAVAEQNLLTYSQDFTQSLWVKSSATATGLYNAPDGTTTANLLTISTQYGGLLQSVFLISGITYTFSIYVLAVSGTNTYTFRNDTSGTNLGTFTPTGSWARYSVTFTAAATGTANLWPIQDRNASGFGSVYIWGAQLEQRSAATAYTPTTTTPITNYIPQLMTAPMNVPRLDYDPITGKPLGLLIEETRTNLFINSSLKWTLNVDTTPAAINYQGIAPDGTNSAWIIPYGATGRVQSNMTTPSDTLTYTFSFYAKSLTGTDTIYGWFIGFNGGNNTPYNQAIFNFSTQAPGTGWKATLVGNGWVRLSYSLVNTSLTTFMCDIFSNVSGTASTGTILYWGAQLEAGSFATSYIATTSTSVTRYADQASMTGTNFSSWYNQSQGTIYAETDSFSTAGQLSPSFSIDNGVFSEIVVGRLPSNNSIFSTVDVYGVNQGNVTTLLGLVNANVVIKIGVSIKVSSLNVLANGSLAGSLTPSSIPQVTQFRLGNEPQSRFLNGHIRKLVYYPQALSTAELQGLTS